VSPNQAPGGYGGGLYNGGYGLLVTQSTVGPANTAADGAGVYSSDPAAFTNTTIAENTATEEGGGIYNDGVGDLANTTLFGNTAQTADGGGNLYLDYYALTLHDTLIAAGSSPTAGGNCAFNGKEALIVSQGHNAEDANQCALSGPEDQVNASLLLGPLQSNGGPTATVALGAGSKAIDAGDPAGCTDAEGNLLTVDQRGTARPQGARCDIGAYEYVPPPTPRTAPPPPPTAPKDTGLKLSPASFAPEPSGASIARKRHSRHKKPPRGTTVTYTDSEAATTTFEVVLLRSGWLVGRSTCKVPSKHSKRPKHAKSCTLAVTIGGFTRVDGAGANSFRFTGRINGRPLAKGSYVLRAAPKLGGLTGPTVSAAFTIL
jgi:hypothetical protein